MILKTLVEPRVLQSSGDMLGFDKGGMIPNLKNFMGKFMNVGKDPARDITGNSGTDVKGQVLIHNYFC